MFTGIVAGTGWIKEKIKRQDLMEFEIGLGAKLIRRLRSGDSLCVDGVCLTVVKKSKTAVWVQAIKETLKATHLGALKVGSKVNLEPSLRAGDPLGGHFLMGHVDGVGKILKINRRKGSLTLQIQAPKVIMQHLVCKGSVAVDGISLTVQEVGSRSFKVALTPYTLEHTNIQYKAGGEGVNLEADLIGKYLKKHIEQDGNFHRAASFEPRPSPSRAITRTKLTEKFLRRQGF